MVVGDSIITYEKEGVWKSFKPCSFFGWEMMRRNRSSAALVISSSEDEKEQQYNTAPPSHVIVPSSSSEAPQLHAIKCLYTDNVNIAKVASDVTAHLRKLSSPAEMQKLRKEIEEKKRILENELCTFIQYNKRLSELRALEKRAQEMHTLEQRYRKAIQPVLDRWATCTKTPDVCHLAEIDECINTFSKVTSDFVPMAAVKIQTAATDLCFTCGKFGTLVESVGSSGQLYCKECKTGRQVLSVTNGRDLKGEDSSAGEDDGTETDRIELILKRFQGKQPTLPQGVLDSIEAYLNSRSVLKQSEIRALIIRDRENGIVGSMHGTSRALLQEAMRATHNERAFKDINAVGAALWGWDLPVLTQDFENLIIADYRMTQAYYPVIRGKRRSRLNADYRLLRHLITRGFWHPILNEFVTAATAEVLDYHQTAWEKMCELSGLPLVQMRI